MEAASVATREGAPPEASASAAEIVVERDVGWSRSWLTFVNVVFVCILAIYVGIGYAVYSLIA
jgi:hypothetical protein